jgi:hypothetical protein
MPIRNPLFWTAMAFIGHLFFIDKHTISGIEMSLQS